MSFCNEDNRQWSTWEPYTTSKRWTLSAGNGEKTVSVRYRDKAGNVSAAYSGTIQLQQSTVNTLGIEDLKVNVGPNHNVIITWRTNQPAFGAVEYWKINDRMKRVEVPGSNLKFRVELKDLAPGQYEFQIKATDSVGQETVSAKVSFTIESGPGNGNNNGNGNGREKHLS